MYLFILEKAHVHTHPPTRGRWVEGGKGSRHPTRLRAQCGTYMISGP